jgi:hypothetical protein
MKHAVPFRSTSLGIQLNEKSIGLTLDLLIILTNPGVPRLLDRCQIPIWSLALWRAWMTFAGSELFCRLEKELSLAGEHLSLLLLAGPKAYCPS